MIRKSCDIDLESSNFKVIHSQKLFVDRKAMGRFLYDFHLPHYHILMSSLSTRFLWNFNDIKLGQF